MSNDRYRHQRPEGALLERARKAIPMSGNKAAVAAGLSPARWRQIENGYQLVGGGHEAPVIGPADTLARMAKVVQISPEQLRDVGRDDAADVLEASTRPEADAQLERESTPLRRLLGIRDEIDEVIELLRG